MLRNNAGAYKEDCGDVKEIPTQETGSGG
jgi:hypothetical protein